MNIVLMAPSLDTCLYGARPIGDGHQDRLMQWTRVHIMAERDPFPSEPRTLHQESTELRKRMHSELTDVMLILGSRPLLHDRTPSKDLRETVIFA